MHKPPYSLLRISGYTSSQTVQVYEIIIGTEALVQIANHSLHCIAASQAAGAAAVVGAAKSAAALWFHKHCTGLDACSALSAVRCHKTLSIALPKWQRQLCPESVFCRHQQH